MIWQIDKGKQRWKTLDNALISLLEQAHQNKEIDIKQKDLVVRELRMLISLTVWFVCHVIPYNG